MSVANLNGTDFLPQFLSHLDKPNEYRLVMYGTFPEVAEKAADYAVRNFGLETVWQDGYRPFDFSLLSKKKKNILLV
jgi:UDP-N-acetyl-D-mannosaminuronic acid transferase (WecB/TagA/CpsF family)